MGTRRYSARNPGLAALANGQVPAPQADAARPLPPPGTAPACEAPPPLGRSRFPQSQHVLLVEGYGGMQRAFVQETTHLTNAALEKAAVPGVTLRLVTPEVMAPATLISEPAVDTVVLGQVCNTRDKLTKEVKQALMAWVADGHKLIVQDSDACAQSPDYSFLPYPFKTVNPGANGARGLAGVLERSTLVSDDKRDPSFLNVKAWKEGPNDLGDTNVIVEWDARWCGAMWSRNVLRKSGFGLAYAHYGRGLIIYDGFDYDQGTTAVLSPAHRPGTQAAVRSRLPAVLESDGRVHHHDRQRAQVAADGAGGDLHVSAGRSSATSATRGRSRSTRRCRPPTRR